MYPVAKVTKTRGIKGEVQVGISPNTVDFSPYIQKEITLRIRDRHRILVLESARHLTGKWVLKFKGIDHIREAYRLVGYSLYLPAGSLKKEKNYCLHWAVREKKTGILRGRVAGREDHGGNILLRIVDSRGHETLVPEGLVVDRIPNKKELVIRAVEGLFGLN